MDFLQSDFAAVFLRSIVRERKLVTAIDSILNHLEENGERTFYLRYKPGCKSIIVKKLAKIALKLNQLGTFSTIVLSCNGKTQTYQIDALIALCPGISSSVDGPYDKALLREKPLQFSD
jgi:hypothetical protein